MRGYFLLNMFQNEISNTDGTVNPQLPENFFVFRVIDPSNRPRYTKFMLGYLASYQVILILISSGYKDFSSGYAGLSQSSHFTTISSHTYASHLILEVIAFSCILVQDQYLVPLFQSCFAQLM